MKEYKGTDYLEEFILNLNGQTYYGDASSGVDSVGTKRNFMVKRVGDITTTMSLFTKSC